MFIYILILIADDEETSSIDRIIYVPEIWTIRSEIRTRFVHNLGCRHQQNRKTSALIVAGHLV